MSPLLNDRYDTLLSIITNSNGRDYIDVLNDIISEANKQLNALEPNNNGAKTVTEVLIKMGINSISDKYVHIPITNDMYGIAKSSDHITVVVGLLDGVNVYSRSGVNLISKSMTKDIINYIEDNGNYIGNNSFIIDGDIFMLVMDVVVMDDGHKSSNPKSISSTAVLIIDKKNFSQRVSHTGNSYRIRYDRRDGIHIPHELKDVLYDWISE